MRWTDTYEIVDALQQAHPQADPRQLRFTELRDWVLGLPGFGDEPDRCGERVLEAIQMAWIDES